MQGHRGETEHVETHRGTTENANLAPEQRRKIGVAESYVQPTIDAIVEGARTGDVGDGKIFVMPVERIVRIRTGEVDTAVVTLIDRPSGDAGRIPGLHHEARASSAINSARNMW